MAPPTTSSQKSPSDECFVQSDALPRACSSSMRAAVARALSRIAVSVLRGFPCVNLRVGVASPGSRIDQARRRLVILPAVSRRAVTCARSMLCSPSPSLVLAASVRLFIMPQIYTQTYTQESLNQEP